jgi:predicted AlkP superfamily phosphohydrolase/phosphomutase
MRGGTMKKMTVAVAAAVGLMAIVLSSLAGSGEKPRVVVLGFDGMDPRIAEKLLEEGRMPNFQRLREKGTFSRLETGIPPQSPVAWSNFITGCNPGAHGIYDFMGREPDTYLPFLSTTITQEPDKTINIGKWVIPLTGGKVSLLRGGTAFWEVLEQHDVPAVTLRLPSNFPPSGKKTRSISGMGTPDILGTYGTFSFYTTKPYVITDMTGGRVFIVSSFDNKVEAKIKGPVNTFLEDRPDAEIPFTAYIDPDYRAAKIEVQDEEVLLGEGEWSDWVTLKFKLMPFASAQGIVRFYLKSVKPDFELYMSPIQVDPRNPAVPISTPPDYARELAEAIGPFYTQGIAEETWALNEGRLDEREYLQQSEFVFEQTKKMLEYELDRFKWGMLFCYFSTTDPLSHMFWRFRDPEHPMYDAELAKVYGDVIENYYVRMDSVVGHVMERVGQDATIIVLSDHGFTTFRRNFHLNTWLYQNGYISLRDEFRGESDEFFENVSWKGTKAYGLGLNGLYINQIGREGQGVVAPGAEKEHIMNELVQKLKAVVDPETGKRVIAEVYKANDVYHGEFADQAPDLIIGYDDGFRASWETSLGKITRDLLTDNTKKWSGDHLMCKDVIPGVLFTNRRINNPSPALWDVAPTILAEFGIKKLPQMDGNDLFTREMAAR